MPATPLTAASGAPLAIEITKIPDGKALDPHWTTYLQATATPFVAVIAAVIAATIQYRQWRTAQASATTARNKLKLDLFDKRFTVFTAAAQLITLMNTEHVHDDAKILKMLSNFAGSEFLFDDKVNDYLVDELIQHVQAKMHLQGKLIDAHKQEDHALLDHLSQEHEKLQDWFGPQLEVLKSSMRPFLHLTH